MKYNDENFPIFTSNMYAMNTQTKFSDTTTKIVPDTLVNDLDMVTSAF